MNALQAAERLRALHRRAESLDRIIHYMDDDRDFAEDIEELRTLHKIVLTEIKTLTERLSEVRL
jgi:hypothetical protein